ncbi:MAG: aminodeoxychorismate/anthranilate synthase component II [Planctomycetaceae bacterium]|jgi:anthranilate synthase/aminodeoxychorismate synthase-like glutamine amidotransferase|nr:aminodeoxychorismate/anthranilate synthase component II [Planctomycetaceae bacterium]
MILVIDNYDSFVYNLARFFEELGCETMIVRNDAITIEEIRELNPAAIVLSPGPCTPDEAGICEEVIRQFGPTIPILGVCLGHQAIATALGGSLKRADEPVHGLTSEIVHDKSPLFVSLQNPLKVTRYHSLIVAEETLPADLIVTSKTSDGTIMSLQHQSWPLFGVQFHPESVLTENGHDLLENFLKLSEIPREQAVPREVFPTQCQTEQDWDIYPNMRPVSW